MTLKAMIEKRNTKLQEMQGILNAAQTETRAFTEEENTKYEALKEEIRSLDATIKALKEAAEFDETRSEEDQQEEQEEKYDPNAELRAIFTENDTEMRAMNTATNSEGGYVVNSELSQTIIKALKDRSDVYSFFDGTSIPGYMRIPKKATGAAAQWMDENPSADPTVSTPTLSIIDLAQHRLYAESAITQQMVNVQELNLQGFIIEEIAEALVDSIEAAIFNGTGTKQPTGLIAGITKKVTLDERGKLDIDHFKKAKYKLKKSQLARAKWYMNAETLLALDLVKDVDGRPLLQPNIAQGTGYVILGIPVETTDAMDTLETTGAKCVAVLACPEAYHTNTQKGVAFHVYNDSAYTKKGLIGYATDVYLDGKTKNDDAVVGIFNKSA